jgi:hypothetical protein
MQKPGAPAWGSPEAQSSSARDSLQVVTHIQRSDTAVTGGKTSCIFNTE